MNKRSVSKRVSRIVFHVVRRTVRLLSVLIVFLVCSFVFLRLYGVPKPILREVIRRVNAAGVPVDVDSVMLTLRGWKAENVTYYSRHPDDLGPLFQAREVLFDRRQELASDSSKGWKVDFQAFDVRLNPSVEWGVSIPEGSRYRNVDSMKLTLGMRPDRMEFIDGWLTWMGIKFSVNGAFLKKDPDRVVEKGPKPEKKQKTVLPVYVSAEQFQSLEDRLKSLKIYGDAQVKVDFLVDAGNYANSSVDFSVEATELSIRDVAFDEMTVNGRYCFPELNLDLVRVSRSGQWLELDAAYDFSSKLVLSNIKNTITSRQLLLLTPQPVLDLLVKAQLQFDELPQFSIRLGPALVKDLPNAISGTFSIRDVTYCGLLIESGRGNVDRTDNLLNISRIHATVEGQEERAEEIGSTMIGGSLEASVYWDANRNWFGVKAEGSMDPNLFQDPLAIVPIATNVIDRFKFAGEPPHISLELGSSYVDWSTFFIQVQGMGDDVRFHEGLCSTMNTTAFYTNAILRLDPLAAMSGVDFMKGTVELDFRKSTVDFDMLGSVSPALLEDVIYSDFNLFGNKIITSGDTQIKARGILDWETMQATDFKAYVEAERLEIPIAGLDDFSAMVTGVGPLITVSNALFGIYGGTGSGEFAIQLDPEIDEMPYTVNLSMDGADFKECLAYVDLPARARTKGKFAAVAQIDADMQQDFFKSANGTGTVSVVDGELADMPLFSGFSKLMRMVVPGFRAFSITRVYSDFEIIDGVLHSDDTEFRGDIFNAKASGSYDQEAGFKAKVQVQMLSDKGITKVIRVLTDPFFRLFKLRLSGTLSDPVWKLDNFSSGSQGEQQIKDSDISD